MAKLQSKEEQVKIF